MRATKLTGMSLALALGLFVFAPAASADHGPWCGSFDASCCGQYEQGEEYADCLVCVVVLGALTTSWDTHWNRCHVL